MAATLMTLESVSSVVKKTRHVTLNERSPASEGSPRRLGDASSPWTVRQDRLGNAPQHDRQNRFKKQSLTDSKDIA